MHRARILIAEDEPLSRDVITRRLEGAGFDVLAVNDGRATLEAISQSSFDLVLLDIAMPVLNGIDTLAEIRKTYSLDSLPVIVVSAMIDSDDVIAAIDAGANDYVVKPVNFRMLHARIRMLLRMKRTVSLLVEAERRRVMVETLARSAAQLAKPLESMIDQLESAMDDTTPTDVKDLHLEEMLRLMEESVEVLEKLREVAADSETPYDRRIEQLDADDTPAADR